MGVFGTSSEPFDSVVTVVTSGASEDVEVVEVVSETVVVGFGAVVSVVVVVVDVEVDVVVVVVVVSFVVVVEVVVVLVVVGPVVIFVSIGLGSVFVEPFPPSRLLPSPDA